MTYGTGMTPSTGKTMLLPDAEILEDVAEDFVCGDFSDYAADVIDGFADVLGGEVCGEAGGQSVLNTKEGSAGVRKGLNMSKICY